MSRIIRNDVLVSFNITQSDMNPFRDDMGHGYFFLVQHKTWEPSRALGVVGPLSTPGQ